MSTDLLERLRTALADRYAVEREIGRGGMAVVFLAEDLKHGRKVAIKVLHPELGAAVGADRFLREIETIAGLNHPHVLPLHDSGEADGLLYYVMPFVDGESLGDRLEREGQLPLEEALRIAGEVADGLDYAHERGVVHRDIKPGNILLSHGHALIADFGIAKAIGAAGGGDATATATGLSVGTPLYMSPEQAAGATEIDGRSDVYALGCVLWEMLAGQAPFDGPTPHVILARKAIEEPPEVRVIRKTVPPALENVLAKAMAASPADRPATARQMAEELAKVSLRPEPRRSPVARRLLPIVGVAVITVLAAVVWMQASDRSVTRRAGIAPGSADADLRSIAVLPFADMSPDKDQEYFSDGISEELLNLLATIPELRVTSRTSAFSFKGQNLGIPEIAERLNVAHILEGSVRKDGNQVRITAQLIDTRSDTHLWSDTWDRSLDDIFSVQDEIAAEVVTQLKITLLGAVPTVKEADPEAYALFLQARQLGRQGTVESLDQSIALYERALKIDPDYAAPWAGLARNYNHQVFTALRPSSEGLQLAREAANRALEIDPDFAVAYALLGESTGKPFAMEASGLAPAAQYFERALALEPTNPDIIGRAAFFLQRLGRLDDAIALNEYVVARDPMDPSVHVDLAFAYYWAGRLDDAIASWRTALSLSPGHNAALSGISDALLRNGEPEAALEAYAELQEGFRLIGLPMAYHALGQTTESDAALAELIDKYERGSAYNIAYVLAFRGEADRAFEWLDKAVEYNDGGLALIVQEPLFANIHDDPRWLLFLESIGMSPEELAAEAAELAAIEFEVTLPR